ncbi:MAG: hypothetical protein V1863_06785 [Candidatus Omnitrophota bacterium]
MGKNIVKMMNVVLDAGLAFFCLLASLGCFVYGQEQGAWLVPGQDVNALASTLAQEMEVNLDFRDPFQASFPREPVQIEMGPTGSSSAPTAPTNFSNISLTVTGIAWGTDKPRAIINDRVVGIGDRIASEIVNDSDKIEVLDISKEGVLVKYGNQQFLLKRASGLAEKQTNVTEPSAETTEPAVTNQTDIVDSSDVSGKTPRGRA